jgi:hypothetical protein
VSRGVLEINKDMHRPGILKYLEEESSSLTSFVSDFYQPHPFQLLLARSEREDHHK